MTVKELRIKAGMSQDQFARELGVSVRSVAGWEAGTHPSPLAMNNLIAFKKKHKIGRYES